MTPLLADGNLLVALTVIDHVHHEPALSWFETAAPDLATSPSTEGTLLRFLIREGRAANEAVDILDLMRMQPWHRFWADTIPYSKAMVAGVIGHRQVTDAYLVALAQHHGGRIATFDRGLASLHPGDTELIASG